MGKILDKTKAKIKRAVGFLTGNGTMRREGERQERKAKTEAVVKDVKDAVVDAKNTVTDAANAVKNAVK
jgi:uncharacterized protein YjbJ (UPF0337 family)